MNPQIAAAIRQALGPVYAEIQRLSAMVNQARQSAIFQDEVDAIPGRRIFFHSVQSQDFTAALGGQRGPQMNFLVSQDGPFVMTHYPMALWRGITADADAQGVWRPVLPYRPLTSASFDATDDDNFISISYEMSDSGSQRNFQDAAAPPILSLPDDLKPLPQRTLFRENSTISFIPTYERINFAADETPTATGRLVVALVGFKVITGKTGNF